MAQLAVIVMCRSERPPPHPTGSLVFLDTKWTRAQNYNSNQAGAGRDHFGNGNKFMVPTIVNGKVFVGTPNGVAVLGLLP